MANEYVTLRDTKGWSQVW